MAYKGDWKKIKSLLAGSTDGSSRFITPLFAHWNKEPVKAKTETSQFIGQVDYEYSYLVTLLKRSGRYQVNLYLYVMEFDKEVPLMTEIKHFKQFDYKNLIEFLSTPNQLFRLKDKHKHVRLYAQTRMSEEEFENEVQICRGKQT